ncbi:UvrD-helicase domain-containing protein [Alkalimonas mucilaginosa]|uniref:DNA 3'-5' helicase n=1 Tax=Alkalimonas mucilaginosa TaxID=3057676 RepID=A0ABU7JJI4_9GAMM|nr:UvrD-helicase domain-containing protein [Alkalimonas sp. MEB004]MEE2025864.1 UvrD-helicase domain-containing protein [Alkalimonas sp. MEB004]
MRESSPQALQNSLIIQPHWLLRLFGRKPVTLTVSLSVMQLSFANGSSVSVLPDSLANPNGLQPGVFFSTLSLGTNSGVVRLSGLPKSAAVKHYQWLQRHWLRQLQPVITSTAAAIEQLLAQGYPRASRLTQAVALAKKAVARFERLPDPAAFTELDLNPFQTLLFQAGWGEKDFELLRERYIKKELAAYQGFFDTVESKPLTDKQRQACVIDEDNNLVLAGAGTGKTSTMVGRAGYLVQSGQARADEILMLAFANKAALEMEQRLEERLGDCGIKASTFHKLGKDIIASVEGKQPSLTPLADDAKLLAKQVHDWFEQHLQQPAYQQLVLDYFQHYLYPLANPFDFQTEGEYFDFILANDIRTLKSEKVKSLGECLIANHLLRQGIDYQYEANYEHPTATVFHRQYQPDFYLPEYGIYIEFYGIDRQGNTAPYIDREQYHADMAWKQELHKVHGTRLITLYHYQHREGTLYQELDKQLAAFGVVAEPLPAEAVLETLREFGAISAFAALLAELLKRYRANCYEPGQLDAVIAKAADPDQVQAAMSLLLPVVDDYQRLLLAENQIDFDDMIGKAIAYVKTGRFQSRWRFILVDEFQDISDARARLVTYLRDSVPDASLFCVGDDWQAIYRFTGSDLQFTTDFAARFGPTRVTSLDQTFRFNNSISDVASRFVQENPQQVRKPLKTLRRVDKPAVSLLRADNNENSVEVSRLVQVLTKISHLAAPGSSVYLLGRFGFNLPDKSELQRLARQFSTLKLESYSIHASKGKEADYVVLLGLENGKHGFPSRKQTHPLLEALLPESEAYAFAEERRLFYVALTRARHRVYLITDMAVASDFVVELLTNKYPLTLDEFDTSLSQQLFHLIKCIKCKTGSMVPKTGPFGAFFGCNKYPLCNHKERGCSQCGSPMTRKDRFKVCINDSCNHWVPVCPKCGAEMVLRKGPYSNFWGCRNYRKEGASCGNREQVIAFESALSR